MTLPLVKLGMLGLKVVLKPFSTRIKNEAKTNASFRSVCYSVGQGFNSVTARMNVWTLGHRLKNVKPLEEEDGMYLVYIVYINHICTIKICIGFN